jgi:transposase, IS30 family
MQQSTYTHLTTQERAVVMAMRADSCSARLIAKRLGRSPSSISRELKRTDGGAGYDANQAHLRAEALRIAPRRESKLRAGGALMHVVTHYLKMFWSPEQIAGSMRVASPDAPEKCVSHETIYKAIYAQPRGAQRNELVNCLRHHNKVRKPRSRGADRRRQIAGMTSIHARPAVIESRETPGHWEGDLIKGAGNRSSVGTLIERASMYVALVKLDNATTKEVVDRFAEVLNQEPAGLVKSMTYDQGREMHGHGILTEKTGAAVYFADPHSPWQRGSNENTNGLLRQYLPKGSDLSTASRANLNAIALSLNTRPRKTLGWRTPIAVYTAFTAKFRDLETPVNKHSVALGT